MCGQVIQMNMEIALVCAQLCVMAGARAADNHDLVNRDFVIFNNIIDERIKIAIITSPSPDGALPVDLYSDPPVLHHCVYVHVPRGSPHVQVGVAF